MDRTGPNSHLSSKGNWDTCFCFCFFFFFCSKQIQRSIGKKYREDLIGNGPKCLIRDKNSWGKGNNHSNHKSGGRKSRNENSGRRESEDKKRSSHSKKQRGNKSRGFEQKSQRGSKGKKRR